MKSFNFGKYRVIVISIALFLVFDLGVLILNFYISSEIAKDATAVNLAGRQRMLSQKTVKSLLDIQNKNFLNEDYSAPVDELKNTYSVFDTTINAFENGGNTLGGNGSQVELSKIEQTEGNLILDDAALIWGPYKRVLSPILTGQFSDAQLFSAVAYASNNNIALLGKMNDLTFFLEKKATDKAKFLRMVQVIGISLATINFIIILFHFIKQLRKNDELLEFAKNETDEILNTVNEGLFLLNKDYSIGSQYSAELENIFRRESLENVNFKRLLSSIVKEKTLQVAVDYIDLLFGDRVNEKLVVSLNPLDKVEVLFVDKSGEFSTHYLSFTFSRVAGETGLSHLLVTVVDVTEQVLLEKELLLVQEKSKDQINLLTEILPMEPDSLINFLNASQNMLDKVNAELRKSTRDDGDYTEKVDTIFRYIHRLKGDASALGFKYMQKEAHTFEKSLVQLRNTPNLTGNDFLSLAIELEDMYRIIESVRALFDRLGSIRNSVSAKNELGQSAVLAEKNPIQYDWTDLEKFTVDTAAKHGKKASIKLKNFAASMPAQYSSSIRELLIQLIRNSIAHGIEEPRTRKAAEKPEEGLIKADLQFNEDGSYSFVYRDDGLGLNPVKIRRSAVKRGLYSEEEASELSEQQLVRLLFKPGFSTNDDPDEDSGRGVGMDIIRSMVNEMNGKLRVASSIGKYCQFTILIPAPQPVQEVA